MMRLFTEAGIESKGARALRTPITLEEVHAYLVDKIAELLVRQPALLMSILYRIDVSEFAVTKILSQATPSDVPSLLASLVIHRQLQKVRLRSEYGASPESRR